MTQLSMARAPRKPPESPTNDEAPASTQTTRSTGNGLQAPAAPGSGPVQRERRNLDQQHPLVGGARSSDPKLSTRDCADRLGVSPKFIVGEILDGRLAAHVRQDPGQRAIYRVSEVDFDAYVRRFWPSVERTEGTDGTESRRS
jgi:hypothetical protein